MEEIAHKINNFHEQIEQLKIDAMNDCLKEIERLAILKGLDSVHFGYSTHIIKNEKEIDVPEIHRIDALYCQLIHSQGFTNIWIKELGWLY